MSDDKRKGEPAILRKDRARLAKVEGQLSEAGLFVRGTLSRVFGRCGKPTCHCAAKRPRLHGPYVQWTRKVAGKTVTTRIRSDDVPLLKEWISNSRRLDRLVLQAQTTSLRVASHILKARARQRRA